MSAANERRALPMRSLVLATTGVVALVALVPMAAVAAIPVMAGAAPAGQHWPSHTVLAEPARLGVGAQVIDSTAGVDFALTSTPGRASYRLRRTDIASGQVKLGPRFGVPLVALAAGSVWVYGPQPVSRNGLRFRLRLDQVNPSTLAVIRSRTLSAAQSNSGSIGLAPGGNDTVFVGFLRTILLLKASSGAIVSTITVRPGLNVSDVSTQGRYLYVAANGPYGQTKVFEFNARTGAELASTGQRPLLFSVGGARLTTAPGGVWVSFRTGMLGETVLLRQQGLQLVHLPGSGTPEDLFAWAMSASTEYAGRSVFLAKLGGQIGCMNPTTGGIRARGSVPGLAGTGQLLGADPTGRVLYGLSPAGVMAITPPAACR
jgi:hypothetical protein